MMPVVDRLQAEQGDQAAFVALNARDGGDGEAVFAALGLAGHPAIVIFDASGRETYRQYGVQTEADVRAALAAAGG
jgi:hypothetical protein